MKATPPAPKKQRIMIVTVSVREPLWKTCVRVVFQTLLEYLCDDSIMAWIECDAGELSLDRAQHAQALEHLLRQCCHNQVQQLTSVTQIRKWVDALKRMHAVVPLDRVSRTTLVQTAKVLSSVNSGANDWKEAARQLLRYPSRLSLTNVTPSDSQQLFWVLQHMQSIQPLDDVHRLPFDHAHRQERRKHLWLLDQARIVAMEWAQHPHTGVEMKRYPPMRMGIVGVDRHQMCEIARIDELFLGVYAGSGVAHKYKRLVDGQGRVWVTEPFLDRYDADAAILYFDGHPLHVGATFARLHLRLGFEWSAIAKKPPALFAFIDELSK